MKKAVINKNLELDLSLRWFKLAFYTFRELPLHFIFLGIISVLINFLPLLGQFLSPLLVARFAAISNKVERQEQINFTNVFEEFFANGTLIRLAYISFIFSLFIIIVPYALDLFVFKDISYNLWSQVIRAIMLVCLLILQIALLLSPVICLYNSQVEPLIAMWLSIKVGYSNMTVFILYSLLFIVFTILAVLPLGLGLLIWLPIINIAPYYIYKSAFMLVDNKLVTY